MSKCSACGFESDSMGEFCSVCGSPLTNNGVYVSNRGDKSESIVESINKKIAQDNAKTKSFTKLNKEFLKNNVHKVSEDEPVREYRIAKKNTEELEKEFKRVREKEFKLKYDTEELYQMSESRLSRFFNSMSLGKDTTEDFEQSDIEENYNIAIFSYIPFLFFIPIVIKPSSKYIRFHTVQGFTLLVLSVLLELFDIALCTVASNTLSSSQSLAVSIVVTVLINIYILMLIAIGIANAVKGKARELPFIGKIHILKLDKK